MRRVESLLNGIEHYSKVLEVLCNGTPYLPWIWAPIKLMLQLSSEYLSSYEKLIDAYAQIAETIPRFDRLSVAFQNEAAFQELLAMFYADILDFHRRAYKFFRARGILAALL
ncbi:putative nacht domain protein [Diplodia seriata]|uniref:Putative nacht domain protein n=1 Tax=Diplodia seriata TaxID=420778 RepID=A0A0G2DS75_9PEZI|nr:putative nacht domain protein [Diplodia seriata]